MPFSLSVRGPTIKSRSPGQCGHRGTVARKGWVLKTLPTLHSARTHQGSSGKASGEEVSRRRHQPPAVLSVLVDPGALGWATSGANRGVPDFLGFTNARPDGRRKALAIKALTRPQTAVQSGDMLTGAPMEDGDMVPAPMVNSRVVVVTGAGGTGCRLSASKTRLHQTHLRGRPSSRCRELDCGEVRQGVGGFPRRALEIQPYRGAGQCVDSKGRAHPLTADMSPERSGRRREGVLVMVRLDARAALAQSPPVRRVRCFPRMVNFIQPP